MITPDIVPAPDPVERLQRYSRFVALVAEQLDALRDDDAERFRRLAEERQVLERELDGASLLEEDAEIDPIGEGAALARLHDELGDALSELDERLDTERWKEEQWALLSDGAIRSARSVPTIKRIGRAYPEMEERTSHLDRRF